MAQRACGRARTRARWPFRGAPALGEIASGLSLRSFPGAPRRGQFHASTPRLRQANGNGLLRRTRAMFPFADVFHFFADKFAGLCGWRFAFSLVFTGPFDSVLFWHSIKLSPQAGGLDVTKSRAMLWE
jgi:hypothetical protein